MDVLEIEKHFKKVHRYAFAPPSAEPSITTSFAKLKPRWMSVSLATPRHSTMFARRRVPRSIQLASESGQPDQDVSDSRLS